MNGDVSEAGLRTLESLAKAGEKAALEQPFEWWTRSPEAWLYLNSACASVPALIDEVRRLRAMLTATKQDTAALAAQSQFSDSRSSMLDALEALLAVQNGPPLIRDQKAWNAAMESAQAIIRKHRPS